MAYPSLAKEAVCPTRALGRGGDLGIRALARNSVCCEGRLSRLADENLSTSNTRGARRAFACSCLMEACFIACGGSACCCWSVKAASDMAAVLLLPLHALLHRSSKRAVLFLSVAYLVVSCGGSWERCRRWRLRRALGGRGLLRVLIESACSAGKASKSLGAVD